jgi:hypothetical protein
MTAKLFIQRRHLHDLSDPLDFITVASSINNKGQIVGVYVNDVSGYGFLYVKGTYTTISVPGSNQTQAMGINYKGQIVGQSDRGGFLYSGGTSWCAIPIIGTAPTRPKSWPSQQGHKFLS